MSGNVYVHSRPEVIQWDTFKSKLSSDVLFDYEIEDDNDTYYLRKQTLGLQSTIGGTLIPSN